MTTIPITLKPHQKIHTANIWNQIVDQCGFSYVDTSRMGLGKTHVSLYIALLLQRKYGMKVAIVGPSKQSLYSDDGWNSWAKKYGLNLTFIHTYPELRAHRNVIKHKWLRYNPTDKTYHSSMEMELLARSGVFVIFDEFHKATRDSSTHHACAAIVRACRRYPTKSRVGLISYTPGNMPEHYPNVLKMLGVITKPKLYNNVSFTSKFEWDDYGIGELMKECKKYNPKFSKNKYFDGVHLNKRRIHIICKKMYDDNIKTKLTFAMPKPSSEYTTTYYNMFFETNPEDLEMVNQGIEILSNGVGWNNGQIRGNNWNMGHVTRGLALIERGKLRSIIRYVKYATHKNPRKKFVIAIGARCLKHLDFVKSHLYRNVMTDNMYVTLRLLWKNNPNWSMLNKDMFRYILNYIGSQKIYPDIMNGSVKPQERINLITKFQSNSDACWCLLITPGTGAESISLHDTHGDRPREILISPDYHHTRVIQTSGRIDRVGVKSNSRVLMVYSKQGDKETAILKSMAKKSEIAKDFFASDQSEVLPSDYPSYIEGDVDLALERRLANLRATK